MRKTDTALAASPWNVTPAVFPAAKYHHPPSGLLQLRLVRRGSSYADIDLGLGSRHVFTRPGDLVLSLPDSPTTFEISELREITLLQVNADHATHVLASAGGTLNDLKPLLARPFRDALIAEILRRLERTPENEATYRDWSLGVVLATLLRRAKRLTSAQGPSVLTNRRLRMALDAIDARVEHRITVGELAAAAGMPKRAFSNAFREAMGMPAYQYVLRQRAELATALLITTQLPLADVAQRCGFSHQAHMTRVLRRLKGKTPGQLRSQEK